MMYSDKHFEQKLEYGPNGHLPHELSYNLKRKKKQITLVNLL